MEHDKKKHGHPGEYAKSSVSKKILYIMGSIFTILVLFIIGLLMTGYVLNQSSSLVLNEGGTNSQYQHDADIVRLKHLYQMANYIEEYKRITGEYPLVTNDGEMNITLIGTPVQLSYAPENGPPFQNKTNLEHVLKKGLGDDVKLYRDPQNYIANNKPVYYFYMTEGEHYSLAVYLHNERSFTYNTGPFNNKVEVSSYPEPEYKIWNPHKLFENDDFKVAINAEMYKEGYFATLLDE